MIGAPATAVFRGNFTQYVKMERRVEWRGFFDVGNNAILTSVSGMGAVFFRGFAILPRRNSPPRTTLILQRREWVRVYLDLPKPAAFRQWSRSHHPARKSRAAPPTAGFNRGIPPLTAFAFCDKRWGRARACFPVLGKPHSTNEPIALRHVNPLRAAQFLNFEPEIVTTSPNPRHTRC